MQLKQPLIEGEARNVSEITILIFSFITAFTIGIILISVLFVTVKKIESKLLTSSNITYSAHK